MEGKKGRNERIERKKGRKFNESSSTIE